MPQTALSSSEKFFCGSTEAIFFCPLDHTQEDASCGLWLYKYIFPPDYFYYWYCPEFSILLEGISVWGKQSGLVTVDNLRRARRATSPPDKKNTPRCLISQLYWVIKGIFLFISLRLILRKLFFLFSLFCPFVFPSNGLGEVSLKWAFRQHRVTWRRNVSTPAVSGCLAGFLPPRDGAAFWREGVWWTEKENMTFERRETGDWEDGGGGGRRGSHVTVFPRERSQRGLDYKKQRLLFLFFFLHLC